MPAGRSAPRRDRRTAKYPYKQMATTTHQLKWESFEKLPDSDGLHRELIEGELQILPPPKLGHSKVASNAAEAIRPLREHFGGRIFLEAGYQLTEDRRNWIQPDVSFVRTERVRNTPDSGYLHGGPDLAIEVVSPSESAADLNRKVELLLKAGSLAVWVIYSGNAGSECCYPGVPASGRASAILSPCPSCSPAGSFQSHGYLKIKGATPAGGSEIPESIGSWTAHRGSARRVARCAIPR